MPHLEKEVSMGEMLISWLRSLAASPSELLEIDCSGATEPDARAFEARTHSLIVFDEASPSMVLRCKKFFQASNSWVSLGQSATNCHSYRVWSHRVRMVGTNSWDKVVQGMDEEDGVVGEQLLLRLGS